MPKVKYSQILAPRFYEQDAITVAKKLLGKGLFLKRSQKTFLCEIVETEAYLGAKDPASHAFRGISKRNWPMFEAGGTIYVYLSYGINHCFNVVTGKRGRGEAVLIRAAAPLLGEPDMRKKRGLTVRSQAWDILSGPGKLTQGLGITLRDNGTTLYEDDICILDLDRQPGTIGKSSRIGISKGKELLYRFFVKDSPWLSRKSALV